MDGSYNFSVWTLFSLLFKVPLESTFTMKEVRRFCRGDKKDPFF